MQNSSAYARIGVTLAVAGAIAAPVFFFVADSVALTALALSSVLLGFIALLLARSLPKVSPRAAQILLDAGLENLAGLVEELGVEARAIYLPSRLAGGKPRALIPLHSNPPMAEITRALPQRMIVDYGPNPEDVGILVVTPGGAVMRLLDAPPGSSSSEMEATLARVLVGALDLATSVLVAQEPGRVTVNIAGIRLETDDLWIYRVLGSPIASVAAAIAAEGLGRPVTIQSEAREGDRLVIRLEVHGHDAAPTSVEAR
jgi:hypothetical protein